MINGINTGWSFYRAKIFILLTALILALVVVRLFWMQVVNRPGFIKAAAANRIRAEVVEPVRGGIFDKKGRLLVENRPSYTVYAHPWIVKNNKEILVRLSELLEVDEEVIGKRIGRRGWNTFLPAVVMRDLNFNTLAHLEAIQLDLPGILFRFEVKRGYPFPEAVHLLGYIGERTPSKSGRERGRFGLVGKRGVEFLYEKWLGGEPGVRYFEVDATGLAKGYATDPAPIASQPGWNLYLNIDANLQRHAYKLMDGRPGAVVAIDPRDGSVLTLLSLPDYDPSLFAGVLPKGVWDEIGSDPAHPLLNRAVQGTYPPGSTIKMAILAAGFEEGIVDDEFTVTCKGGMQLGRRFFRCWKHSGHGKVTWREAIQQSCDVFFYSVGMELGIDRMSKYFKLFGFGSLSGIDLDGELSGIVPNSEYYNKKYGKGKWTKGQEMNVSIGQGDLLVTPLQLAVFTAGIASGNWLKPRIGDRLTNPSDNSTEFIFPTMKSLPLSFKTLEKLREGMYLVVNEDGGTARAQKRENVIIAGKTGTSQNPHGEDHGLFVAFAPFDDPVIAVAVIVEHGEHGSSSAAPVAGKLIEKYLIGIPPEQILSFSDAAVR